MSSGRWWLLAGMLLLPLMVTGESLWLDEGGTTQYVLQPDLHSWWHHLLADRTSDSQMPFPLLVAWEAAKLLGTREWQLRAVNILWGMMALLGVHRAGRQAGLPWLAALLSIQPYFWFYSNEARQYAAQIAGGAWLFAAFTDFVATRGRGKWWPWLFSASAVFLCLSTMVAPVSIASAVLVGAWMAWRGRWRIEGRATLILAGAAAAALAIGAYYVSTLARGARGAQLWHVDPRFFAYVLYEITGLTGLGPAIARIRDMATGGHLFAALSGHSGEFIGPAACFLALAVVLVVGLRQPCDETTRRWCRGNVAILAAGSAVFILCSIAVQKAFWGRHFAPLFPFYVGVLGAAIAAFPRGRFRFNVAPLALSGLLLCSALSLRFSPEHRKEDYRAAARFARMALDRNQSVWWVAGPDAAIYYHVDCAFFGPEPGKALFPQSIDISKLPPPDVIVYSKPDAFDANGAIHNLIVREQYRPGAVLRSFVIWIR